MVARVRLKWGGFKEYVCGMEDTREQVRCVGQGKVGRKGRMKGRKSSTMSQSLVLRCLESIEYRISHIAT